MQIQNDYFLLYHGKNAIEIESVVLNSISNEYYPILSLILTLKKNNFTKIIKLKHFKELLKFIYPKEIATLEDIYPIQQAVFSYLYDDEISYTFDDVVRHIKYLHTQEILPLDNYKKLISLFENSLEIENDKTITHISQIDTMTFKEAKEFLLENIEQLKRLFSTDSIKQELVTLKNYLNNQIFSVGITGVINSGKSTMLNALIGKEILGSSVVPETANLTILKYGQASARVFYWNKAEWENIIHGAKSIESMKNFVEQTEDKFALELEKYITEDSFSETILVEDISNYTSVKSSNSKCNLVKYVELNYNLEFLKDNIEIVDTPGLDDPVVQREEITKEYLSRCDVMLHLMNVSQSATAKDIEFIIDAILYQYIAKILIVITHADTVSKKDIQEVISYTKSSIKKQLENLNKSSRVDYILEHIDFIPISAKVALLHKIEPSNPQDSGFVQLEEYLQDTLFGKSNNKSELIIRSVNDKLKKYIDREKHFYNYSLEVLSQSKTQLKESLENKRGKHSNAISLIIQDMTMYKNESIHHLKRLDSFLNEEFLDLKNVIKERLYVDVKYSYEKDKKIPDSSRSKIILQTALKDGIIDIVRDYRYKFSRKEENYIVNYERKIKNIDPKNESNYIYINIKNFFEDSFLDGFLTFSTDVFVSKILNAIKNSKSSKLEFLNDELYSIIEEEMDVIVKKLHLKAKQEATMLINKLFELIFENINIIKERFDKEESFIQNTLDNYDENCEDNSINIIQKIKEIEVIKSGLSI